MKKLVPFIIVLVCLSACEKKRYFSSGPEIDLAKKADEAYFKGDWTTLRSMYLDTAKIIVNEWSMSGMSPDKFIENLKTGVANYSSYKQGDGAIYEMVVDDSGNKYTHSWQEWIGTHKNGKEVRMVVNISAQIVGDKIAWAGLVYDTHPLALAEQPDSTAVMK